MRLEYLFSKIHLATVTDANLAYEGSLTVSLDLMEAASMHPFQKVLVSNCANGNRFETYLISGQPGSGEICLNGAAALLGSTGDRIIIMTFCLLTPDEIAAHKPIVVHVDESNRPIQQSSAVV